MDLRIDEAMKSTKKTSQEELNSYLGFDNNNDSDIMDLRTDEAMKSATTTSQEELFSYLGLVAKPQTNTPEVPIRRSSLRVKVKQIAMRNLLKYKFLQPS